MQKVPRSTDPTRYTKFTWCYTYANHSKIIWVPRELSWSIKGPMDLSLLHQEYPTKYFSLKSKVPKTWWNLPSRKLSKSLNTSVNLDKIDKEYGIAVAKYPKMRWLVNLICLTSQRFTRFIHHVCQQPNTLGMCSHFSDSSLSKAPLDLSTWQVSINWGKQGQYIYKSIHLRPSPVTTNWWSYKGRAIWFYVNYMKTPAYPDSSQYTCQTSSAGMAHVYLYLHVLIL